ncbi:hypothetical protein COO60DRAFT_1705010 [Scenedesmus sp. NREL 46B-D3]|nr:hypothetical protein COO60DRAFT_1705010 [Scenedesmus sp. NREL 46B-D3]
MISTKNNLTTFQPIQRARTFATCAVSRCSAAARNRPAFHKLHAAVPEAATTSDTTPNTSTPKEESTSASHGRSSTTRVTPTSSSSSSSSSFQWLSHWYPVHVLDSIDPTRPHAIELLGKQLVLWRAGAAAAGPAGRSSGQHWQCFENACPHRLAPLSEGRVALDGTLQCSYHGWRFDQGGSCVEIPQALDARSKQTACASRRSCAVAYPTREAHGLIWVWPSAGPAAARDAAAAPLPVCQAVQAAAADGLKWYRRELPYSWDILAENLTDPAHVMFAHHKLTPSMDRDKAGPMPFKHITIPAAAGTAAATDGASPAAEQQQQEQQLLQQRPAFLQADTPPAGVFEYRTPIAAAARMAYTPPCSITCEYDLSPRLRCQSELLLVPCGPGRSLAITMIQMTNAPAVTAGSVLQALMSRPGQVPGMLKRLLGQPLWQEHLGANQLFDMDNVFLNMQDRLLSLRGRDAWGQAYYMPTPSDSAVIAARRWMGQALQQRLCPGDASSPAAADVICLSSEAAAAPPLPKTVLNDRFNQHTKHCRTCQHALQQLNMKLAATRTAMMGLAAAAAGLAGALVTLLLTGSDTARLTQQADGGLLGRSVAEGFSAAAAAGGFSAHVLVAVAVLLGAAAVAAAVLAGRLQRKVQEFKYVEFAHADNE